MFVGFIFLFLMLDFAFRFFLKPAVHRQNSFLFFFLEYYNMLPVRLLMSMKVLKVPFLPPPPFFNSENGLVARTIFEVCGFGHKCLPFLGSILMLNFSEMVLGL